MLLRVHFDAACEPRNPSGNIGVGVIAVCDGDVVHEYSKFYPAAKNNSNNVGEYMGFIEAVQFITYFIDQVNSGYFVERIEIRGDSKLVIEQMMNRWRIKNGLYVKYAKEAKELWRNLQSLAGQMKIPLSLQWLPREQNEIADKLSKQELINHHVEFKIQPQD